MTEQEIKDIIDNKICLHCGKPITGESQLFCDDCYNQSIENIKNDNITDDWTIDTIIFFTGIFGWDGREVSMEKLKEIFSKKDKNNGGN